MPEQKQEKSPSLRLWKVKFLTGDGAEVASFMPYCRLSEITKNLKEQFGVTEHSVLSVTINGL